MTEQISKSNPKTTYMSDQRLKTGPECQTMTDVRYEIDRLDRILVELINERTTYIEAAARIKTDRNTVRDNARIEDVVSKVITHAEKVGLNTDIAEPVWRLLIERSIAHEFVGYDSLKDFDINN